MLEAVNKRVYRAKEVGRGDGAGMGPIIMKNLQQKFGSASNNYEKVVTEIWAGTVGPMAPWGQWRIFT